MNYPQRLKKEIQEAILLSKDPESDWYPMTGKDIIEHFVEEEKTDHYIAQKIKQHYIERLQDGMDEAEACKEADLLQYNFGV